MADWDWRQDHPRLHEFVVDELDAFLTTPDLQREIQEGADRLVELHDEELEREKQFAQRKRKYIETEVAKRPYLLDPYQEQEPQLWRTHTHSRHAWHVTQVELETIQNGPLERCLSKYEEEAEVFPARGETMFASGVVNVACWVPHELDERDLSVDFLLPPPLWNVEQEITRPRTRLENLMGLVLVHDSHGEIERIIPAQHPVWSWSGIWFLSPVLLKQVANDSWVPDLKALLRRVRAGESDPTTRRKKKIKPTANTVGIIRAIQNGKDNDEVGVITGSSMGNIRKVRSLLEADRYEI